MTRWFFLLLLMLAPCAHADTQRGFLYEKTEIAIQRATPPAPLPWAEAVNPVVKFNVDVREASNIYNPRLRGGQTGWFNVSAPEENGGTLIVFKEATLTPIKRTTEFSPLDILLVESDGRIGQIARNVKLNELEHDIVPEKPVLAFLFLQGGVTQKLAINQGDRIDHPIFQKSALVIDKDSKRVPLKIETTAKPKITAPVPRLVLPPVPPVIQKKPATKRMQED